MKIETNETRSTSMGLLLAKQVTMPNFRPYGKFLPLINKKIFKLLVIRAATYEI